LAKAQFATREPFRVVTKVRYKTVVSHKGERRREASTVNYAGSTTAPERSGPARPGHPRYGRVDGAVTPTRGEDAAATMQISIAVSRHPRRLTVINKRYVREKRERYGASGRATNRRTGSYESAGAADVDGHAYRDTTRMRRKLLMQMASSSSSSSTVRPPSAMIARCTS